MSLSGWVCLVTGASRGIGQGIALQLSEAGATVYITGRQEDTLKQTAAQVKERGGNCVPVICDSTNDKEIEDLFERIKREQNGRLDILVNNAYAGVHAIFGNMGKKFWETDPTIWDSINNTGLRGHYFFSVHASRMMVAQGQGLIVTISSMGGLRYLFNVPYGVGKAACDRLAADMAVELKSRGVASVSLWPGAIQTELVSQLILEKETSEGADSKIKDVFTNGETTEFSGMCIVNLAKDKSLMSLSGKVLLTCDLARRYGFQDVDGRSVTDYTSLKFLLTKVPYLSWLSVVTPSFLHLPRFVLTLASNRF
ncbi:dehydrogenase/reductase SDR family member 1-like [Trematomus bernacchii]|uniref:dehydrogenase/reductase SDR family member 1-like n=1 Tax=Trematomus bernacchii TaxID=40690 RepID=UPI00146D2182|nr:dehydrogenase/reductase SDR family member 1-like [Trematomus bernacchii]